MTKVILLNDAWIKYSDLKYELKEKVFGIFQPEQNKWPPFNTIDFGDGILYIHNPDKGFEIKPSQFKELFELGFDEVIIKEIEDFTDHIEDEIAYYSIKEELQRV